MAVTDATTILAEYSALTGRCGLVDRSERGKLALRGADAAAFLNGQVTNDIERLRAGEGCYAAFLTHKGKMLGDLRVLAVGDSPPDEPSATQGPTELLLDTERTALQALFDMIRRFKIGYDVELHKRTLERSLLSLIGPAAEAVVASAAATDELGLGKAEHSHVAVNFGETPVRLIRTNVGIDALLDSSAVDAVREALLAAGAVQASEQAAEIVRVEHGRPRYGIDMDDTTIPQEAGLNERAVSFTKGCYVGQETVARLHYRGKPNRHLRGLRLSTPTPPGSELRLGDRPVGALTSSVLSPTHGPIGLALVRREAEPGATLTVGDAGAAGLVRDGRVAPPSGPEPPSAVVVELPFR